MPARAGNQRWHLRLDELHCGMNSEAEHSGLVIRPIIQWQAAIHDIARILDRRLARSQVNDGSDSERQNLLDGSCVECIADPKQVGNDGSHGPRSLGPTAFP